VGGVRFERGAWVRSEGLCERGRRSPMVNGDEDGKRRPCSFSGKSSSKELCARRSCGARGWFSKKLAAKNWPSWTVHSLLDGAPRDGAPSAAEPMPAQIRSEFCLDRTLRRDPGLLNWPDDWTPLSAGMTSVPPVRLFVVVCGVRVCFSRSNWQVSELVLDSVEETEAARRRPP
jgi:hypothetical protein